MHDLLSDDFSKPIIDWVGNSERINYYLHDSAGFKYDTNTKSNIYTNRYASSELSFVNNIFDSLDDYIDLDFTRVFDRNLANIEITKADDNAKLLGESNILGYAQPLISGDRVWMDLWWKNIVPNNINNKYTEYTFLSELESFTITHELGHALGLAHPRNNPEAKWHNTNDTIMSYNVKQISGNKALNFSDADISTLQLVYGKEDDGNSSQAKIPNTAEKRTQLSKLSHTEHSLQKSVYEEDELIGIYEAESIFSSLEGDDLLNYTVNNKDINNESQEKNINVPNADGILLAQSIDLNQIDLESNDPIKEENSNPKNSINDSIFDQKDYLLNNFNNIPNIDQDQINNQNFI